MLTMIIGVVLNLLGILALWSSFTSSYYMDPALQDVFYLALGLWGISVVGALLCLSPVTRRAGSTLVSIGSLIFFPLGLIAMIGARKMLNEQKRSQKSDHHGAHHSNGYSDLV
ncbi:hypothetical protein [Kushneria phosphatilytica]|uniref:Uncharacterized protein n=1 Tax=Kushneria phosphatilytica TaxID=657387 RepID=A0A1S1NQ85_9GAMM|nr:hypothetical protein [Kushneria phosphatilytica]OHV10584.1 hypothetical protein BH688_09375 [Kushneria phosphatilytica]QEL11838.1 hypothetical protein FY550_12295 [Kushneria phosphatilytica]